MVEYKQVVVWPGTTVGNSTPEEFESFILNELGTRSKLIGEFITSPDYNDSNSGGRTDLCFYVATEDIGKFAVPRFAYGMRWLEDVLDNEKRHNEETGIDNSYSIYPEELRKLYSW